MTSFEWIALIGAAAWLPQLGALAYRFLVKPRIHMVPVGEIELTHNMLGPIINLRSSIITERKDAVIIQMSLTAQHEQGRTIHLLWDSYVEQFSEIRSQAGTQGEFARDQLATALKVNTALPLEKFFRFRDPAFKERIRELTTAAGDELARVPDDDPEATERFLKSREYTQLAQFHRNAFAWEPGRYVLEVEIRVLGLKRPRRGTTAFRLSEPEVDNIRRNIGLIEQRLEAVARRLPDEQLPSPSHWVTPTLEHKEIALR